MSTIKFKEEYLDYNLGGCFVDKDMKFALIHIFKNASISIRNALGMRGRYLEWSEAKNIEGLKTICVIRNPRDRFISAYQYILTLNDGGGFKIRHPIEKTKETNFYKNRENVLKSFIMFLEYIEENGFYDAVTVPQAHFLKARRLEIDEINYVLIQEKITVDFESFCVDNNIPNVLRKDNQGNNQVYKKIKSLIYKDISIERRISDLYKEDYELYNNIMEGR